MNSERGMTRKESVVREGRRCSYTNFFTSALDGVERPLVRAFVIELKFCRISTDDEVPVLGEAS